MKFIWTSVLNSLQRKSTVYSEIPLREPEKHLSENDFLINNN